MNTFARAAFAILASALLVAPASAQDWLVGPAPAIPLHVPVTPPPTVAPPVPAPIVTPPSSAGAPHDPDAVQRLLDPYGVSSRPSAAVPPRVSLLPSISLGPTGIWTVSPFDSTGIWQRAGAPGMRFLAPPVIAFPGVPVAWLLGF